MDPIFSDLLKAFGPSGMFIAFLIWEMQNCQKDRARFIEFIERQAERTQQIITGATGPTGPRGERGEPGTHG